MLEVYIRANNYETTKLTYIDGTICKIEKNNKLLLDACNNIFLAEFCVGMSHYDGGLKYMTLEHKSAF